ncbi:MAG: hydroxylamine reductase [Thermoguttaceae bacterium]|nr:hydroxylamine reductase [Thermoguttaceae bacterium]
MGMFCFQCQETVGNTGCTRRGVCGKSEETASILDELIRLVRGIALREFRSGRCAAESVDREVALFVVQSLFTTITNGNFDDDALRERVTCAKELAGSDADGLAVGVQAEENEDIRSLRELLLYGLKGIAAYVDHAAMLGFEDPKIYAFILRALAESSHQATADQLTALVMECGATAVEAMALLDRANTETFGKPEITTVKIGAGQRPGVLISGHDLLDLKELLDQTADQGIDVYTHSEMLAAHAYPQLKKYPHLYGNYGNAWHRQSVEFGPFQGPILMTTNCITPVQEAYRDRIFTTGIVGYPGVPHIADRELGGVKDFSPVIELAKRCAPPTAIEEGEITIGFAHEQVLSLADKVIEAVKSGAIRRFIVMAGCDGRHKAREYYTLTAQGLPEDTVILTAGCAKYRYNKLGLGSIGGIPRVLDAGQCNDSYSLAVIALKLKEAFSLEDINDLPISFDIAWYEQKAVAVLLALLSLGFKGIRLGPTLPAFLSKSVAQLLVKTFGLKAISTPEEDIRDMLG